MESVSDFEWRPVVGYEGYYEVSDYGDVRRIAKTQGTGGGLLKLGTHPTGYRQVALSKGNVRVTHQVHRLVAAAFIGPCPEGLEVCHNNQVHGDNRAVNLRYDTHKANCEERAPGVRVNYSRFCKNGHEYTPENTRVLPQGWRECRACRKAKEARRPKVGVDLSKVCKNGHDRAAYPQYTSPKGITSCGECRRVQDAQHAAKRKARLMRQRRENLSA